MAYSFKNTSSQKTFGVFAEPLDASEYINNKKARATYCVANNCTPAIKVGSESNKLLFNRSNKLSITPCINSIDKTQLYINLITKLDLADVPVILDYSGNLVPCPIDKNAIPYLRYNIDPCGNLFGNTICGTNNFTNYMVYNNTTISTNSYVVSGSYIITKNSNYNTIITFTANGKIQFLNSNMIVNYICVGGGGGGGSGQLVTSNLVSSGGGGGGGVKYGTLNFSNNLYNIIVGNGGLAGSASGIPGIPGDASFIKDGSANVIVSDGGYGGQTGNSTGPNLGGSGGASGTFGSTGGSGGNSTNQDGGTGTIGGGGGGGIFFGTNNGSGGDGGLNISVPIYGTYFGAGGGGGIASGDIVGNGGNSNAGNGGDVNPPTNGGNGLANTGGGGGGGGFVATSGTNLGGNGGSGVVILYFNI